MKLSSSSPDLLGVVMKNLISFLGNFVIINMYVDLKEEPMARNSLVRKEYDFIVVGGGSAGCVVASRLSEDYAFDVLLLEAGGDESLTTQIPWLHAQLPGSEWDWKFQTLPQKDYLLAYQKQVSRWPRGFVIGGTSSINTMIYMRGNRQDYDRWEREGNYGWSYKDVLPYFTRSEDQTDAFLAAEYEFHGVGGPLTVSNSRFSTKITKGFLEAGEYFGYKVRDPNGAIQEGFSEFQMTIKNGIRWSTSRAFLRPAHHRPNLQILLNSRVYRILFDHQNRAVGVQYFDGNRKMHTVYARKEIILSAGTVMSPFILLHSGIGPYKHLNEIGIPVIADLPVGQNLQDHVGVFGLSWTVHKGFAYNLAKLFKPKAYKDYKNSHSGPLAATVGTEGNAFVHSSWVNRTLHADWPDLQLFFLSLTPAVDGGTTFSEYLGLNRRTWETYFKPIQYKEGFSIVPVILRPYSRGFIQLGSLNPWDMPIIQPNYLKNFKDFEILKEGLKISYEIGNSLPFRKYGAKFHRGILPRCPSLRPPHEDYWNCYIHHFAQTEHHIAGTCKMGPKEDSQAVVDPELRVYGVKGLRVIDGSIMPYVVSGNTNVPIIMIGEKGADLIKSSWYH